MSFSSQNRGAKLRGQVRQERIAQAAAKRQMLAEARRDSDSERQSGLGRILSRLLKRDR